MRSNSNIASNSSTHSHNLRTLPKIENEIDLITNSISKKSRLHYQTDNKYLNLRRLNSNRIEKLNNLLTQSNNTNNNAEPSVSFHQNDSNFLNNYPHSPIFIDEDSSSALQPLIINSNNNNNHILTEQNNRKIDFLHSFNLVEVVSSSKQINHRKQLNLHRRHFLGHKPINSDYIIKKEETRDEKYDLNYSIVEQYLHNPPKSTPKENQISKLDFSLSQKENLVIKSDTFLPADQTQTPKITTNNKIEQQLSICDYLTRTGATQVPIDGFQHVLVNFKHSKQISHQQIDNLTYKSINFCKLEFLYDENYYWIVKIKKISPNIYQMKFVRNAQPPLSTTSAPPSTSSSNMNESYNVLTNSPTCNNIIQNQSVNNSINDNSFLNDSISVNNNNNNSMPNFNWLFTTCKESVVSQCLIKCLRPIGWSKKQNKTLRKPQFLELNHSSNYINDLYSLLNYLNAINDDRNVNTEQQMINFTNIEMSNDGEKLDLSFNSFLNCFNEGNLCEFVNESKSSHSDSIYVFIVKILKNIAGRLLIEFNDENKKWIFYSDRILRPLGWASAYGHKYSSSSHSILDDINTKFQFKINDEKQVSSTHANQFKIGYFVECLYENKFYAARVIEVVSNFYIKLKLFDSDSTILTYFFDDLTTTDEFIYGHSTTKENINNNYNNNTSDNQDDDGCVEFVFTNSFHTLFPCKWCSNNNLKIELPGDYPSDRSPVSFDWDFYYENVLLKNKTDTEDIYLTKFGQDSALFNWSKYLNELGDRFQIGMYLECVLSCDKNRIVLGQIKAKLNHLIFVKIITKESESSLLYPLHIFSVDSNDLFPVGWCEMNNYYRSINLDHDECYVFPRDKANGLKAQSMKICQNQLETLKSLEGTKYWCDAIYLNTNCNNGPLFIKSKLEKMPKVFGPGPIVLIIHKILQLLINASEKPFKLLKLFQAPKRNTNAFNSGSNLELDRSSFVHRLRLKSKEKGKYIFREVEICQDINQIEDYLTNLCSKFKCCNRMLSIENNGSLNLNRTKGVSDFNSYTDYEISNHKILATIKCCVLCTINYFSNFAHNNSITNNNNNETNFQSKFSKPVTNQVSVSKKSDKQKSTQSNQNQNNKNSRLKDESNFSPIKTRFNLRLMESIKSTQEQQQRHEYEEEPINIKEEFKVKRTRKTKAEYNNKQHVLSNSIDEPIIKKSKNQRFIKSLSVVDTKKLSSNGEQANSSMGKNHNRRSNPSPVLSNNINNDERFKKHHSSPSSAQSSFVSASNSSLINNSPTSSASTSFSNSNNVTISNPTNPIYWSIDDVCKYLLDNRFDQNLIHLIKENEIDGQSFLMLNLPTIQNYMGMKLGPAIKLAHLVERLKQVYYQQFNQDEADNR